MLIVSSIESQDFQCEQPLLSLYQMAMKSSDLGKILSLQNSRGNMLSELFLNAETSAENSDPLVLIHTKLYQRLAKVNVMTVLLKRAADNSKRSL